MPISHGTKILIGKTARTRGFLSSIDARRNGENDGHSPEIRRREKAIFCGHRVNGSGGQWYSAADQERANDNGRRQD
jgi:hypothetical protein